MPATPKADVLRSGRLAILVREAGFYGAASGVALLVDIGLLALLSAWLHLHYLVTSAISFVAGGVVLYVLSVTFVFGRRRVGNRALELSLFLALGAVGFVVNAAVIYAAIEVGHVPLLIAKLIAAGCTFGTNFVLRRYFLFSPDPTPAAPILNESR